VKQIIIYNSTSISVVSGVDKQGA